MLWASIANAHLMPRGEGTLNLIGRDAYVVITLPVRQFAGLDQNQDGLVDGAELQQAQPQVIAQFRQTLTLHAADGQAASWLEVLPALPSGGHHSVPTEQRGGRAKDQNTEQGSEQGTGQSTGQSTGRVGEVMLMGVARFAQPPTAVRIDAPTLVEPIRITGTVSEGAQTLQRDVGWLDADGVGGAGLWLFAPLSTVLAQMVGLGAEHIMLGFDHALFVLVLLAAGQSLRRWLTLLTVFTMAHGSSLAWVWLGGLALSDTLVSWLIEPAIAASIVLVGASVLLRWQITLAHEAALVLALGLIHGLGFASAMQVQPRFGGQTLASLLGFNLGVELGQLVWALGLAVVFWAARRLAGLDGQQRLQRWLAAAATGLGMVWVLQRAALAGWG